MRPQPSPTRQRLSLAVQQRAEKRTSIRRDQATIITLNATIRELLDALAAEMALASKHRQSQK
jgi:hypothetical protein